MSDAKAIAGPGHPGPSPLAAFAPQVQRWSAIDWRRLSSMTAFAVGDAVTSVGALAVLVLCLVPAERPRLPDGAVALESAALLVCLGLAFGLYEALRMNPVELFRRRVQASAVFSAFLVTVAGGSVWSVSHVLCWLALVPATVVLGTLTGGIVETVLKRSSLLQTRVLLVGEPAATQSLSRVLDAHPALGLRILARITADDPRLVDPAALAGEGVDLAVVMSSGDARHDERVAGALNVPTVLIALDVGDVQGLWSKTRMIGSVVGIEFRRSRVGQGRLLKRAVDLALGCCLLLCALPFVALAAAAIWCVDRHNPFYVQARPGLGGRIVRVWKIRSMFVDAEARLQAHLDSDAEVRAEWTRNYKLRHDPRILPGIGSFIRRSSLDELPQLWNVVRGDMSLVGPRPFPHYHLEGFDETFRKLRASVMPGLTGFWQITARSDGDLLVQQRADEFYVRNCSIWLDLYILLHTLPAVLSSKGAR